MDETPASDDTDWSAADRAFAAARVRRLALATLAATAAVDAATIETALADPDTEVRRLAAAATARLDGSAEQAALLTTALADDAAQVRYEALNVYGTSLRPSSGCGPLLDGIDDEDPHVSLLAVDLLASGCPDDEPDVANEVVVMLAAMARSLPGLAADRGAGDADSPTSGSEPTRGQVADWHYGAHALLSLATLAPEDAAPIVPDFASHATWQVRMYTARAAAAAGAGGTLEQLAGDDHPNVVEAALRGLAAHDGERAGPFAVRALESDDYQLLITAARVLQGSDDETALPALVRALERITAQQRQTSRDPRRALLERIGELGSADQAEVVRRYVDDFDPVIAAQAAEILLAWTGTSVTPAPRPPAAAPFPALDELLELDRSRARVVMEGGGVIEIDLHALEAPTNAARFARLARDGYFDGLTFHRVVPNFVIQGGSPGANEYAGAGSFSRDELDRRSHLRGTVGISTRGRDTGDAQIFVNLVDNVRLDHNFTIIGTVVAGMDVVDDLLEGGTIARISIETIPDSD